ncbi:MAG: DUF2277 family protein, partial [Trebonia sp.]
FRAPAARNSTAFDQAVQEVAASTARLLAALEVRQGTAARDEPKRHVSSHNG